MRCRFRQSQGGKVGALFSAPHDDCIRIINTDDERQHSQVYWATHQRFFAQLCLAFKVDAVTKQARKALDEGMCVVIGLQTTGTFRPSQRLLLFLLTSHLLLKKKKTGESALKRSMGEDEGPAARSATGDVIEAARLLNVELVNEDTYAAPEQNGDDDEGGDNGELDEDKNALKRGGMISVCRSSLNGFLKRHFPIHAKGLLVMPVIPKVKAIVSFFFAFN